ncbi:MAG: DUF1565 domain-containing protein [Candidatus Coatesbacteria bacterium]|nr:DUF1565 domain-containing protein [Candidatus Coatesbacteria bacterium]
MKRHVFASITAAIVMLVILPALATPAPQVFIYTDRQSYQAGDTIEVSLAGQNEGEGMSVDVYIGLLTPDGALWTLGELAWSEGIGPWIQNVYLPSQFNMERCPFFWFPLPCEAPLIDQPGEFAFMAALMRSGTLEFVSAISAAPFEVVQVPRDYYVDAELGDDANVGSEDAPWLTITHALNSVLASALSPVTIHVAPGTYDRSWPPAAETFPLKMKSWVSLVAEGPETTIDGEGSRVISCEGVEGVTIQGFTITGGGGGTMYGIQYGAGIFCLDSSVLITDNMIVENRSGGEGTELGGGAGIYCRGGSPFILDNVIALNTDIWKGDGGGILCEDSAAMIVGNVIANNKVDMGEGCGIYIWASSTQTPPRQISNNTIVDNIGRFSGISGYGNFDGWAVVDCIVWSSREESGIVFEGVSASYCCIRGGHPGEGNIDQDPMLVADWAGPWWLRWRRYLNPESPCIDAGSRSAEEAGLSGMTTQLDGTPDTGRVDMGVHYPVPQWTH